MSSTTSRSPWISCAWTDRQVVDAADAGLDAGQVGAVDVQRDRRARPGVAYAVDVAGRGEAADLAHVVLVDSGGHEVTGVQGEQLLALDAPQNGEHAPGQVVVDRRGLAGEPHQGDDRERAVRL